MTNAERYKTAKERRKAYQDHCIRYNSIFDGFDWLEWEYEEEFDACPFCGEEEVRINSGVFEGAKYYWVECKKCFCRTPGLLSEDRAIEAWNRRVK